jgi:hypothetical protein
MKRTHLWKLCLALTIGVLVVGLASSVVATPLTAPAVALAKKGNGKAKGSAKAKHDKADDEKDHEKDKDKDKDQHHDNGLHRGQTSEPPEPVRIAFVPQPAPAQPTTNAALVATATSVPATPPATGLIVVHVMRCPAGTPAAQMDWEHSCRVADSSIDLQIQATDGPFAGWFQESHLGNDGIARFWALPAGRYRLDLLGIDWCHAESDNVDRNGDLVVVAGDPVNVWTYLC